MISLEEFKMTILADRDSEYNKKLKSRLSNAGFSGDKLIFAMHYATEKSPSLFVDEDFAKWASAHNRTWNDSNIFCDSSVNSLSNCCRLKSNIEDLGYFDNKQSKEIEEKAYREMYEEYLKNNEQH